MSHAPHHPRIHLAAGCAALLLLGVLLAGIAPTRGAAAQPPSPPRPEVSYVPDDAAMFVHLDAAQLWNHPTVKAIRAADPKIVAGIQELLGTPPENLSTVTLFFPKVKIQDGEPGFGLVLTFKKPVDPDPIEAAFGKVLPKESKSSIHMPNDRTLIVLSKLGAEFAKPRTRTANGPLTSALRDAAHGSHVLVAGATLANLPDQLRDPDLPAGIEPFRPLFKADTIAVRVDLGDEIAVDVRVKAQTPAQAIDAEKALGMLSKLLHDELDQGFKQIGMDDNDPLMKDLIAVLKAGQNALVGAKYSVDGTEAKVVVRIPADLPFPNAYLAASKKVREAAASSVSANNLKQIAIAMHNYHDVNNGFPPAAVCDKSGKPLLSWRVLILPYVEQDNLYQQFKLDEAWDSEHNKKLLAKMPRVYALPDQKPGDTNTHYRVFVGNGAAFDTVAGHKLQDFADGTSNTAMVVTAAEAVPWSKPDDLAFDPDKDMPKLLGAVANGRIQMAYCDGSVRTFSKPPSRKTLNAIVTRSGGEIITDDDR